MHCVKIYLCTKANRTEELIKIRGRYWTSSISFHRQFYCGENWMILFDFNIDNDREKSRLYLINSRIICVSQYFRIINTFRIQPTQYIPFFISFSRQSQIKAEFIKMNRFRARFLARCDQLVFEINQSYRSILIGHNAASVRIVPSRSCWSTRKKRNWFVVKSFHFYFSIY